ncbi:MAG: hypothetical protein HY841_00550 [Bacteroidetes bacterium]|nr:hypothetical protein [Bacteroidota bacterium]
MKQHILLISAVLTATAMSFSSCNNAEKQENKTEQAVSNDTAKAEYACPMHPEIKSDKLGTCSQCGMDLEKVK